MPRVSVIIPTYNYAQYVTSAVDSVFAQTVPAFEVIVVDDGSTDNTSEVLARYGDRIHVVRKGNEGLAAARNSGAKVASGDLLAFLDSDDIWLPQKLERQVQRYLAEPELGLIHCGAEEVDATGAVLRRRLDGAEGWIATDMLLFRRAAILLAGSTMLVSRSIFDEVGGFDGRMRHSEDWDFCFRVAYRHKVGFVPEILVQYRLHDTNMHHNVRNMEHAMLFVLSKVFRSEDPCLRRLRRRSYGNLHTMLAGSFFSAGQYSQFIWHAVKGLVFTPENISQFLGYPIRYWRRHRLAFKDT